MALFVQLTIVGLYLYHVSAQVQCTEHSQHLPSSLSSHMLGYSNASQSVYLIGGLNSTWNRLDDVYKWDTKSTTVATLPTPSPVAMTSYSVQIVASIDDIIHIVSPRTLQNSPFTSGSAIHRLNATTELWLTPINFTVPSVQWLVYPCVAQNGSHIIAVDGYDHYRVDGRIHILFYEVARDEWTSHILAAPFSTTGNVSKGWRTTFCAYAQDALYIFGGMYNPPGGGSDVYLDTIYKYEIENRAFVLLGTLPAPLAQGVAVYDGSRYIYLVGGYNGTRRVDAIHVFDVNAEQLLQDTICAMFPFNSGVSMVLDKQLWIFGGRADFGRLDIVQTCDISSFTITKIPTLDPTSTPVTLVSTETTSETSTDSETSTSIETTTDQDIDDDDDKDEEEPAVSSDLSAIMTDLGAVGTGIVVALFALILCLCVAIVCVLCRIMNRSAAYKKAGVQAASPQSTSQMTPIKANGVYGRQQLMAMSEDDEKQIEHVTAGGPDEDSGEEAKTDDDDLLQGMGTNGAALPDGEHRQTTGNQQQQHDRVELAIAGGDNEEDTDDDEDVLHGMNNTATMGEDANQMQF